MNHFKTVINRSFTDFDDLTETLQGWNLEIHKLDSSPFIGDFFQLISPDLILSRGHFSSRLKQIGEPPRGYRTFGVLGSSEMHILWRGKHVDGNDLFLFPPNSELHASTDSGFHIFTISIKESILHRVAEQLQLQGLDRLLQSSEVFRCERQQMNNLRTILQNACIKHENNADLDPSVTGHQIAMQLIQQLSSCTGRALEQPTPLRQEIIRRVEQQIFEHTDDPPSISDLCAVTGASKRTLEYAFNEYFGLTPKAYINAIRLNVVRKQLRAAQAGHIRVADIANAWGFWHMGQFAADYRKLFSENPSVTLGCAAKPCKTDCIFRANCLICQH